MTPIRSPSFEDVWGNCLGELPDGILTQISGVTRDGRDGDEIRFGLAVYEKPNGNIADDTDFRFIGDRLTTMESEEYTIFQSKVFLHGFEFFGDIFDSLEPEPIIREKRIRSEFQVVDDDSEGGFKIKHSTSVSEMYPHSLDKINQASSWGYMESRKISCIASAICASEWGCHHSIHSVEGDGGGPEICLGIGGAPFVVDLKVKTYIRDVTLSSSYPKWHIFEKRVKSFEDVKEILKMRDSPEEKMVESLIDSLVSLGSSYIVPPELSEYKFLSLCKTIENLAKRGFCHDRGYLNLFIKGGDFDAWKKTSLEKKIQDVAERFAINIDDIDLFEIVRRRNEFAHNGRIWNENEDKEKFDWLLRFTDLAARKALWEEITRQEDNPNSKLSVFRPDIEEEFRFA